MPLRTVGLKVGNALLEIGAAIAAKIGRLGRFGREDRRSITQNSSDFQMAGGPLNPPVMTPPLCV